MAQGARTIMRRFPILTWAYTAFLTLVPAPPASATENFQNEISLDYLREDDDLGYEGKYYGATYTRYFLPVKIDTVPYAEAAFLEQVGDLSLSAAQGTAKFPTPPNLDMNSYGVSYNYAMPDIPWSFVLAYSKTKFHDSSQGIDVPSDDFVFGLGRYYGYGKIVAIAYSHSTAEFDVSNVPVFDYEENDYGVVTKNVYTSDKGFSANLEASITVIYRNDTGNKTTNTDYSIGGDLYLTKAVSIGASASKNTGEDSNIEGESYDARFVMYFSALSSFELGYARFVATNSATDDFNQTNFSIGVRF